MQVTKKFIPVGGAAALVWLLALTVPASAAWTCSPTVSCSVTPQPPPAPPVVTCTVSVTCK